MPNFQQAGAPSDARRSTLPLTSLKDFAVEPDASAVALARKLYILRRTRSRTLGENLFGEPAWDMLLDLFISEAERRKVSVSSLAIGSGGSSTTALRYLGLMEDSGLVLRIPDENDGRRTFIRLTDKGMIALSGVLLVLRS